MPVKGGIKCIKYLLFVFNFIFWVRGTPERREGPGVGLPALQTRLTGALAGLGCPPRALCLRLEVAPGGGTRGPRERSLEPNWVGGSSLHSPWSCRAVPAPQVPDAMQGAAPWLQSEVGQASFAASLREVLRTPGVLSCLWKVPIPQGFLLALPRAGSALSLFSLVLASRLLLCLPETGATLLSASLGLGGALLPVAHLAPLTGVKLALPLLGLLSKMQR